MSSEYFTVQEVAALLKVDSETVTRRFAQRPGVLDLGTPTSRRKRRYRVLRIPREVLERYISERSAYKIR